MNCDWFVARFEVNGAYVDKSPYGMAKSEADMLCTIGNSKRDGYEYKVINKKDLQR